MGCLGLLYVYFTLEPHKRLNLYVDFLRLNLVYDIATDFIDNIATDY